MKDIKLYIDKTYDFVKPEAIASYKTNAEACNHLLHTGEGKGNDFLCNITRR